MYKAGTSVTMPIMDDGAIVRVRPVWGDGHMIISVASIHTRGGERPVQELGSTSRSADIRCGEGSTWNVRFGEHIVRFFFGPRVDVSVFVA